MKKRLLSLTLAGILAIGAFTGCGSSGSDTKDTKEAKSTQEDSKKEDTKAGDLEIKVFSDYVQPN